MRTTGSWLIALAMAGLPALVAGQSTTLQMPGQPPAASPNQPLAQPMQPQVQQFPGQVQPSPGQPQLWQPNQQLLQQNAQRRTFQQEWPIGGPGSTGWPSGGNSPVYQTWPQTSWPQNTPSQPLPRTGWPDSSWSQPQPGPGG